MRCWMRGGGSFITGSMLGGGVCVRSLMSGEDVLAAAVDGVVVACEAKAAEGLGALGLRVRVVEEPLAGDALALALERIAAGDFDDAATLDANYLRRTDMEIFAKAAAPRDSR